VFFSATGTALGPVALLVVSRVQQILSERPAVVRGAR
jgi:hypothetical protein